MNLYDQKVNKLMEYSFGMVNKIYGNKEHEDELTEKRIAYSHKEHKVELLRCLRSI